MRPEPRRVALDAAHVGRGDGGRLRAARLPDRQRVGTVRASSATCSRRVREGPVNDLTDAFEALGVDGRGRRTRWPARSPAPRRRRSPRARREEIAAASKDPKLIEYVRRRDFEGTPEPAPGEIAERDGQLVRDPQAPRDRAALRRAARARRGAPAAGRSRRACRPRRATSASRCRPRTTRSSTARSRARSPKGHYGAGEVRIFDDGWYEPVEWTDDEGLVQAARPPLPGPRVPLREDADRTGSRSSRARRTRR